MQELPDVKSDPPPFASADGDVIVNVVELGTVITCHNLSSNVDAAILEPVGMVTESNSTISPICKS